MNPIEMPFRKFSPAFLRIKTKDARVIPFELNETQVRLDDVVEERLAAGRPVRILVLKARQQGISTYSLGRQYEFCVKAPYRDAFMVCHDDDSTVKLFERLRMMYDMATKKPMVRFSSRRELDFSNPNRKKAKWNPGLMSKVSVGTAGKLNVGRSQTIQFLHCSEVAFWKNASRVLLGLEQAVPAQPGTIEILESTANGVGGEFYDRWKRAESPETAGDWIGVFLAWHDFPEYQMPLGEGGIWQPIPSSADSEKEFRDEESELRRLYGLSDAQLNWRRWAIKNLCGDKIENFHQEYPSSATEAFITSGNPVFNQRRIEARMRVLRAHDRLVAKGDKKPRAQRGVCLQKDGAFKFKPVPDGNVFIYKWPERRTEYVLAADSAEGVSLTGGEPDKCAAHIFDRYTWEQVAVVHGIMPTVDFARLIHLLGVFYNQALLVPESNNHGHTVCTKLQDWQYTNIYIRQEFDALGTRPIEKPGFETNAKTRPQIVDSIDEALNSNLVKVNHIPTLDEMMTFVRNPRTGKEEAAEGCHDDLVLAFGIGLLAMRYGNPAAQPRTKLKEDPQVTMVRTEIQKQIGSIKARQIRARR